MLNKIFLNSIFSDQEALSKPVFSFSDLKDMLLINLSKAEYKLFLILVRFFDLSNFAMFWSGRKITFSFDEISQDNVKEILSDLCWEDGSDLESIICDFLYVYNSDKDRLDNFASLTHSVINHYSTSQHKFISDFFYFKQEFRLLIAAKRACTQKKDFHAVFANDLITHEIIDYILLQRNNSIFEFPKGYERLKDIFNEQTNAVKLEEDLFCFEIHKIKEICDASDCTMDLILGNICLYLMVLKRSSVNNDAGSKVLETLKKAWYGK